MVLSISTITILLKDDKIYKKIVYDLHFPEKQKLVMQDTTMFKIDERGLLIASQKTLETESKF